MMDEPNPADEKTPEAENSPSQATDSETPDPQTIESAPPASDPAAPAPAPSSAEAKPKPSTKGGPGATYFWGTGRRKTAVARVRIKPGDGKFEINDRAVDEFFKVERDRASVRNPLAVTETAKDFDVFVNVRGGGLTGQTGAVLLGLARALVVANSDNEPKLREHNLLTRDARKVERKKYGRRGARRRFQFSKR